MATAPELTGGLIDGHPSGRRSLRQLAIRGGGYLIGREAIGMVVRLVGVVVVVRLIGPASYGIYSGAVAFSIFVATFAQMGLEVYLIRQRDAVEARHFNQAFTLLLVMSVIVTATAEGLTFALGGLLRPVGVVVPLRVLLLCTPLNVLWAPAQAAIERRFAYRTMGLIELGGDVVLYATAIPLAFLGERAWALVAGFFAWQSWLLVASITASGLKLRWDWSFDAVRGFFHHGLGFSAGQWLNRTADLVNPLVVGTFFGAAGVGYVAFAQRLVDTVGFAKRSAYRLGIVAMSRVSDDDQARIRYSVEEGSLLQLLALGIPFACFGVVARWGVPFVFGHQWSRALPVLCLLGLATTLGASGLVQSTLLYSRGKNLAVACAVGLRSSVLAVASVILVQSFGITGFGLAALFALVGLLYADRSVRRLASFSYAKVLPWVVVLGPPILFPLAPMPWALLLLVPLTMVVLPPMRREVARLFGLLRSAVSKTEAAPEPEIIRPAATAPGYPTATAPSRSPGSRVDRRAVGDGAPLHAAAELHAMFRPDRVTGLASPATFVSRLSTALASLGHGVGTVGVILFDISGSGPDDRPVPAEMKAVAARLSGQLRERDLLAQVGPSSFGVLVDLPYVVELDALAERVVEELATALAPSAGRARIGTARAVAGPRPRSAEEIVAEAAGRLARSGVDTLDTAYRPWLVGLPQRWIDIGPVLDTSRVARQDEASGALR